MYFITNEKDFIIAASKELLNIFDSIDICSIASNINNNQIKIDTEENEIKISNETYIYTKSNIVSILGDLTIYNLTLKSELEIDEEDSIAYLKKVKESGINDDNFNIPPILQEIEEKDKKEEKIVAESKNIQLLQDKNENIEFKKDDNKIELIDSEDKIEKELEVINLHANQQQDIENKIDKESLSIQEEIEDIENKIDEKDIELLNIDNRSEIEDKELKFTENKEEKDNKPLEIDEPKGTPLESQDIKNEKDETINEDYASLLKDIEEINIDKEEENRFDNIEKSIKTFNTEEIEDITFDKSIDEKDEVNKKSGALSKIKSKLFPWSSNKEDDSEIELEDTKTELETSHKSLDNENLNNELSDVLKELNTQKDTLEPIKEDISNDINNKLLDINENVNEEKLENDKIDFSQDLDIINEELKEEATKEVDINLDKSPTLIKEDKLTPTTNEVLEEIGQNVSFKDNNIAKEIEDKVDNQQLNVSEPKLDTLDTNKNTTNIALLHKLITMQVDSVNLEENANKLSINLDNYKLLLENFLEELDNYKNDLKDRVKSTISMLIDASELLSLDIITSKLKRLNSEDNTHSIIEEIDLTKELLREKLNNKKLNIQTEPISHQPNNIEETTINKSNIIESKIEAPTNTIIDEDNKDSNDIIEVAIDETTTQHIPQEAIDITTANELLEKISLEKINFDPEKAVNELNLPKSLILEFVNDFISQAKDHLDQLIDAYKQADIKTLQTTAHMLKGAAGNLRLDLIAEVLFKIQKSNNLENSGELLKKFIAYLKGLEVELNSFEKEDNEN